LIRQPLNGSTKKTEHTELPFIVTFEFGGDKGYWTGNNMILQVEDCIDCLRILFPDQYHYVFLFDHSSGHAKKRIGGLNIGAMNKGFGGEHLRGTLIEKKEGYLGPYCSLHNSHMIQVGQVQELVYPSKERIADGNGPFYLTAAQKEVLRLNAEVELPPNKVGHKEKTKKELVNTVMKTNHGRDDGRITLSKMTVRDFRKIASNLGINTTKLVTHQMKSGWAGKGLIQVLWECSWIDETKISQSKKM
jgi:hypothetical protein